MKDFLIEYLTSEHKPLHRSHLIDEVVRLARVSRSVPRGKHLEWEKALDDLIASGRVSVAGERVQIVRDRFAENKSSGQGELF